jgi:hypothetical protein
VIESPNGMILQTVPSVGQGLYEAVDPAVPVVPPVLDRPPVAVLAFPALPPAFDLPPVEPPTAVTPPLFDLPPVAELPPETVPEVVVRAPPLLLVVPPDAVPPDAVPPDDTPPAILLEVADRAPPLVFIPPNADPVVVLPPNVPCVPVPPAPPIMLPFAPPFDEPITLFPPVAVPELPLFSCVPSLVQAAIVASEARIELHALKKCILRCFSIETKWNKFCLKLLPGIRAIGINRSFRPLSDRFV